MSKFLSFETENQWIKSDSYNPNFEYFRGGEYGCMWLYRDEKTNKGFWLKNGLFMSAPLKKFGTPDLDNEGVETIDFNNLEILEKLVKQQEVK